MGYLSKFINRQYAPKWLILGIDTIIACFSIVVAYLLRFNFNITHSSFDALPWVILLFITVRILTFFTFKTYSGIIRFTSLEEGKRIFYATISGTTVLFGLNFINYYQASVFVIPLSVLIIDFILAISLMAAFRIAVKVIYSYFARYNKGHKKKFNVLIYGAGKSGLITKRTIDTDGEVDYNVLGFLDDDDHKRNKILEGVNIFHTGKDFSNLMENRDIDLLIFSIQEIGAVRKREIIEWCLQHGIKVKSVPPAEKWISGELSFNQIKNARIEDLLGREPIQLDRQEIAAGITNQVVLVTGASGSIGSELIRQIVYFKPKQIVLFDISETSLNDIRLELEEKWKFKNFEIVVGDIRNFNRVDKIVKDFRPQIIFHAAAYKHVPLLESNPSEAVITNIQGTKHLADVSVKYDVGKFVMISTDKAVNPTNVMGASKRIAEIYIQAFDRFLNSVENENFTRFITTRFGNVLGSNGSVIPRFRQQIQEGGPVTVTHPDISRYFMTIPEACQLVLEAGFIGKGGEIFLFDMGESVRIYDLAHKMIKLSGFEPEHDIEITYTGLRPGEKIREEVLTSKENTLPTHHQKILIASVQEYVFEKVSGKINELVDLAADNQPNDEVVKAMKKILPEFKSRNSKYERLDQSFKESSSLNQENGKESKPFIQE